MLCICGQDSIDGNQAMGEDRPAVGGHNTGSGSGYAEVAEQPARPGKACRILRTSRAKVADYGEADDSRLASARRRWRRHIKEVGVPLADERREIDAIMVAYRADADRALHYERWANAILVRQIWAVEMRGRRAGTIVSVSSVATATVNRMRSYGNFCKI